MAITKSAKKALRQSKRKKVTNDTRKSALRYALKGVRLAAAPAAKGATKVSKEAGSVALSLAYKAIDKAVKRGVLKKNTANRRKSKAARTLNAVV